MSFVEAGEQIIIGAELGMMTAARAIMTQSLIECPIDTGTLRESARIEPPERSADTISIRFGYGYGAQPNPITGRIAAEYAVPVHEILEAHHAPPTKAKFLEDPVLELGPELGVAMQASIRLIDLQRIGDTHLIHGIQEHVLPMEGQVENLPQELLITHG